MSKNLILIISLVLFFIVYNILLMKFLPREQKTEKIQEVKKNVKSLYIPESEEIKIQNDFLELYVAKTGGYIKKVVLKKYYLKNGNGRVEFSFPSILSPYDSLLKNFELKEEELVFYSDDKKVYKRIRLKEKYLIEVVTKGIDTIYFPLLIIDEENKKDLKSIEYVHGKINKVSHDKFSGRDFGGEGTLWFGGESKYFVYVLIDPGYFEKIIRGLEFKEGYFYRVLVDKKGDSLFVFSGPKDYEILKNTGYGLENLYPLGFVIVKPFTLFVLYIFKWGKENLKYFALIIFLFSFVMKIVFLPLTLKSLKAMKKMEAIKPRLEALKKAYKDDPQKLNEETLKLYKEMGVNPFSGCLPLLFQLPIFWALYNVLRYDIMFRGEPLFLWIRDLSSKDPFYILPILMGLSSLLQQLLQPTQDKQTRRIGFFMAGFITIIFLNFPSGLVYYWLLYNIFGIFESVFFKRKIYKT